VAGERLDRELTALFKEYDTLRAEILVRVRARFELLGLFLAGAAVILSRKSHWLLWPFGLGIAVLWAYLGTAVSLCARRLVEIEARVNTLVRADADPAAGDPLPLQWETRLRGSWFNRSGLRR
jgi:hypothetical protein